MRISSDESDPGFPVWNENFTAGRRPRIYLDGVEQFECVTVDEEAGLIVRAIVDADGNLVSDLDTGEIATEEVRGDVLIAWN